MTFDFDFDLDFEVDDRPSRDEVLYMAKGKCGTCKWFDGIHIDDSEGKCRFNAPIIHPPESSYIFGEFPQVWSADWCSNHKKDRKRIREYNKTTKIIEKENKEWEKKYNANT